MTLAYQTLRSSPDSKGWWKMC